MPDSSYFNLLLDYEQPLFSRSPSSVKRKKKERAKIGDEVSATFPLVSSPIFARSVFSLHARRTAKNRGCSWSNLLLVVYAF